MRKKLRVKCTEAPHLGVTRSLTVYCAVAMCTNTMFEITPICIEEKD